jgi:hypothetical protein
VQIGDTIQLMMHRPSVQLFMVLLPRA